MSNAAELLGISQRILQKHYEQVFESAIMLKQENAIPSGGEDILDYDFEPSSPYQEDDRSDVHSDEDSDYENDVKPTPYTTKSGRRTLLTKNKNKYEDSYSDNSSDEENRQNGVKSRKRIKAGSKTRKSSSANKSPKKGVGEKNGSPISKKRKRSDNPEVETEVHKKSKNLKVDDDADYEPERGASDSDADAESQLENPSELIPNIQELRELLISC